MGHNLHSPEEIEKKLAQFDRLRAQGFRIFEITRRLGVTDTTLYAWRARRMGKPTAKDEMKRLREENTKLRKALRELLRSSPVQHHLAARTLLHEGKALRKVGRLETVRDHLADIKP